MEPVDEIFTFPSMEIFELISVKFEFETLRFPEMFSWGRSIIVDILIVVIVAFVIHIPSRHIRSIDAIFNGGQDGNGDGGGKGLGASSGNGIMISTLGYISI